MECRGRAARHLMRANLQGLLRPHRTWGHECIEPIDAGASLLHLAPYDVEPHEPAAVQQPSSATGLCLTRGPDGNEVELKGCNKGGVRRKLFGL